MIARKRLGRRAALRGGTGKFPPRRSRSKYGNVSCTYNGEKYDSALEARHAKTLDTMRSAAQPHERVVIVKRQVRVSLYSFGKHICDHIVDFLVEYADGHQEYHEVKGFETDAWNIKRKMFVAQIPTPYIVIRPNGRWERQ